MHVPQTEIILRHEGVELARATVPPGEYVIGRDAEVDIHAQSPSLSRRHAQLTVNYDAILLEDLGSSHGTFVARTRIAETTRLYPNQEIRLGDVTLEVRRQRASQSPEVSLAPAQAVVRRFLPDELLTDKRYAIGHQIARGGMGAVLDARQEALKRTVAMKVMLETGGEPDVLRFIEEAQITGQLDHPNIVPIYEVGVDEQDQLFYTMKLVRGITLKKVLELLATGVEATAKKYPLPTLLTIFQKACDAVAFAHAKGVIHRDLKPENLMLGDFGEVFVMDWGLAKVIGAAEHTRERVFSARAAEPEFGSTMAGTVMGTPQYLSPEQARGEIETLDGRSDIYALGAIFFELLHLRPSVTGQTVEEVVEKVARGEVDWGAKEKGVPDSLMAVCRKALAYDRNQRYARVADLQADLTAYQNGFATSAEKAGLGKHLLLAIKRHKAIALGVAAVLLVGITFGTKAVIEGQRAEREAERANAALLDLKRQAPALRQLAENEAAFQRFDAARDKLDAALALDPGHLPSYWRRAWLLIALERWADAAAALRLAEQRDPANAPKAAILPLLDRLAAARSDTERWSPGTADQLFAFMRRMGATAEIGPISARLKLGGGDQITLIRQRIDGWLPPGRRGNVSRDDAGRLSVRLDSYVATITTLDPLRGLPIEHLNIGGARVSDLAPLRGMPLQRLDAGGTKVSDLSPLAGMPLTALDINQTPVDDLAPLKGLALATLNFYSTKVRSLAPLAGMPLREVLLSKTMVRDLSPLRGLPLQRIYAEGCGLTTAEALTGAPLRDVNLESNKLHDLEFLRGAPLETLNADKNAITSLDPLSGAPLRKLSVASNQIADLTPLRGLPIVHLDLRDNKLLKDLTPLLDLTKLESLHVSKVGKLLEPLRAHPTLKSIAYSDQSPVPAAEFWAAYDAEQAAGKK